MIKTLEQKRDELELELIEVNQQIKDDAAKIWPQKGDEYYVSLTIGVNKSNWRNDATDLNCLLAGNVYRTKEEAGLHKIKTKVHKILHDHADGFVPDWGDRTQCKYGIIWDWQTSRIDVYSWRYLQNRGHIYFATEAQAQKAVDACDASDLKVYLTGAR